MVTITETQQLLQALPHHNCMISKAHQTMTFRQLALPITPKDKYMYCMFYGYALLSDKRAWKIHIHTDFVI